MLDQKVWESQHFRNAQEDLDSIIEMVTVLGPGYSLTAAFFHLLGFKDNSGATMAMILTVDPRILHYEQCQVPLDLF